MMEEFVHIQETPEHKTERNRVQLNEARGNKFVRQGGVNSKLEDALYGDLDPITKMRVEKPVHRRMAELVLQGYTHKEIAAATGYTNHYVSDVLRQPFIRERIIENVKKTVSDEIKELLENEALPAIKVLKEVAHNPQVGPGIRVTAANSLLDRFLGKPVQPISNDQTPPSEMTDEELRKQVERELTINRPN